VHVQKQQQVLMLAALTPCMVCPASSDSMIRQWCLILQHN
jgi:hypothetical protein